MAITLFILFAFVIEEGKEREREEYDVSEEVPWFSRWLHELYEQYGASHGRSV